MGFSDKLWQECWRRGDGVEGGGLSVEDGGWKTSLSPFHLCLQEEPPPP